MDRDAVLVAALGAAVLGACTSSSPEPAPTPSTPSPEPVDPDIAILKTWYVSESVMAARYGGGHAPELGDHHRGHLADLREHLRIRGEPPPAVPKRGPYRGSKAALVKALGARERELAAQYQAALVNVRDPRLVTLGAELSAAARAFAAVLRIEKT